MSVLKQARVDRPEPLVVTICGAPGTGKTTLACSFPGPAYLIRTLGEMPPRDLPKSQRPVSIGETLTAEALWDQLTALAKEEHEFKTAIIDSVTGLEALFADDVMRGETKAKTLQGALGGYGAGREAVAMRHARVRRAAEVLRARGINVVFIAHSEVARIDPPDGEGYNHYTLRMHAKSLPPYVDNVDVVGFVKQATIVRGDEHGSRRAVTTGERVLVCDLTPSAVAKNRLGITEELTITQGVNPLAEWVDPDARARAPKAKGRQSARINEKAEAEDDNQSGDAVRNEEAV